MTMENHTVLRRLKDRTLLHSFALGLSAPALLVTGAQIELTSLRRGESIDHAWSSVGRHISRATRRVVGERQSS